MDPFVVAFSLMLFAGAVLAIVGGLFDGADIDLPFGDLHVGPSSVAAFLAVAGSAGLIFTATGVAVGVAAAAGGALGGLVAAALISALLAALQRNSTAYLRDSDFQIVGSLARVTSGIPAGGNGEIVFLLEERQRVEGARSANGLAIPRGTEVLILGYERGTALVEPFVLGLPPDDGEARELAS